MEDAPRLVLFDADGTLRRCTVPGRFCPNAPGEWEVLPNVRETVARLIRRDGIREFGVASNQGGVALGYLTQDAATGMLRDLVAEVFWMLGRERCPVSVCIHAPGADCSCRKPEPGMLWWLAGYFRRGADECLYVGDLESDSFAAARMGCRFMYASEFFGWDRANPAAEVCGPCAAGFHGSCPIGSCGCECRR